MTNHKTIVFIHGLNLNGLSWGNWREYFEARGYICHAPAYPFHEGVPSELRAHPPHALNHLTLGQVIEKMENYLDTLAEPPILIGHSMGGFIVQKLLMRGKAVAGVSICSAPPRGFFSLKWSYLKSNFPLINPFKGNALFLPEPDWFNYAVANTTPPGLAAEFMKAAIVPESRNVPRGILSAEGHIDFKKVKQPLLFVAAGNDRITPSNLNLRNFRAYQHLVSDRDFVLFPDRSHAICWQNGWEEVADRCISWIENAVTRIAQPVRQ